jgi:hypothetical protein
LGSAKQLWREKGLDGRERAIAGRQPKPRAQNSLARGQAATLGPRQVRTQGLPHAV